MKPEGLRPVKEVNIYGRIAVMELFRPQVGIGESLMSAVHCIALSFTPILPLFDTNWSVPHLNTMK